MDVFISWSGEPSRAVAELLQEWIKEVLQAAVPWVSSQNLDRGGIWFADISAKLRESSVGIICLTKENKEKPWIMFEAGAMAKGLTTSRVCPFLIDLEPADVTDPLAQFNLTPSTKEGVYKLLFTLNKALGDKSVDVAVLQNVLDRNYQYFEAPFKAIVADIPPAGTPKPEPEAAISEVLQVVRSISNRVSRIENLAQEQSQPGPASFQFPTEFPTSKRSKVQSGRNIQSALEKNAMLTFIETYRAEAARKAEIMNEQAADEAREG